MTHETKMEIKRDYYAKARGGVIAFGGLLPIKIPRTVLDKLYTYLETGTVQ